MPHIEQCSCANCTFARQASQELAYSIRVNQQNLEILVTLCTYVYWWFVFLTIEFGTTFWRVTGVAFITSPLFFFGLIILIIYLFSVIFLGNIVNSTRMQMHAASLGIANPLTLFVISKTDNIIVIGVVWIVISIIHLFFLSIGFYSKKPSSNINN